MRFLFPILVFAGAVGIGFSSSKLFERSENIAAADVFTFEEAVAKLRKQVRSTCVAKNVNPEKTTGRTMFVRKDEIAKAGYTIAIDWDHSMRGKHEIVFFDKGSYEKCVVDFGEAAE